jgi:RNA polymerase sigma-70 factor (ECF subfamily)
VNGGLGSEEAAIPIPAVIPRAGRADVPSAEERRLVREAKRGSPEAAEEIVRRHWEELHRVAHLIVRDRAAAEDIAQEAMLSAIRALRRFDAKRPLRPWLIAIVTNRSLDWARSRARRPEVALSAAEPASADVGDRPGGERSDLRRALEELDPETRAMVVLRYVLDFRAPEIGEALQIPAATVRTRLSRGLQQIRSRLLEEAE